MQGHPDLVVGPEGKPSLGQLSPQISDLDFVPVILAGQLFHRFLGLSGKLQQDARVLFSPVR